MSIADRTAAIPWSVSVDTFELEGGRLAFSDNGIQPPGAIEIERLGWFLARLQHALTGDRRRRTGTTESWHRALVTPELTISARNLKDADAHMLDAVARILKKLLWEAWEE